MADSVSEKYFQNMVFLLDRCELIQPKTRKCSNANSRSVTSREDFFLSGGPHFTQGRGFQVVALNGQQNNRLVSKPRPKQIPPGYYLVFIFFAQSPGPGGGVLFWG